MTGACSSSTGLDGLRPEPSGLGHSATIPSAVVFLDFDGVICSPRAFTAQEGRWLGEQRALRWADPVACDMVCRLLRDHSARLVISSTWRHMEKNCFQILDRFDLSSFLHDDWRTGEDADRHRGTEIAAWLAKNGNPPFIILDDDTDFTDAQKPWHVLTDSLEGMMLRDFDSADKLLASARAETLSGSVHESAVPEADAHA